MRTEDLLIIAIVGVAAWWLLKRKPPTATVTTSETYLLPLEYLMFDINGGLYNAPQPIYSQGVSQEFSL